ncbi:CrcB family protein [Rhodococcus sp. H36-A4]|uniref:CrcB family protein n=1 Tax=Rhodococcus sp. H36-A4 TaxID=3004353 RepID=UPI0022AFCB9A|nr:CrcB family protein [Rhodococcus sp. H36-A4]MCZ4076937.1 CrcB family protein [Rhodococcus sp. H36-A4]
MTVLLVAIGGACGALTHYVLTDSVTDSRRVLLLTMVSCGVLGFVVAASPPQWALGLAAFGFLASLAPMSSVALLAVGYARRRRFRVAALFLTATVVGGIACAMLGYLLWQSGVTLYSKL